MNRGKEPVNQKTSSSSNLRVASEESLYSNKKKLFKPNSRGEGSPFKPASQKDGEDQTPKVIPIKIKATRQTAYRAQSVEKMPHSQTNDIKTKAIMAGKMTSRERIMMRQPIKLVKPQEGIENKMASPKKNMSPNKERPVKEMTKSREGQLRKDPLEVVSEENEEHFRETLQNFGKKEESQNKNPPHTSNKSISNFSMVSVKRSELNLEDLSPIKLKEGGTSLLGEEGSPRRDNRKEYESEGAVGTKAFEGMSLSPKRDSENKTFSEDVVRELKMTASNVRGTFTKEHFTSEARLKEQEQKKLMKEFLDSQLNEKKRLKEEERLRKIEEDKKEEARLRREVEQLNKQYEREMTGSKVHHQEKRTESPNRDLKVKLTPIKREDSPELKKLEQEKELSESNLNYGSRRSLKSRSVKDEPVGKTEEKPSGKVEFPGIKDIKKLAEENEQLRNQNLRKNELIDILLTALKQTGQDNEQIRTTPGFPQSRAKSRTISDRLLIQSRNTENFDVNIYQKPDGPVGERISPYPMTGSHFLRFETDNHELNLDEPLSPGFVPGHTYRGTDSLTKLITPVVHTEVKLPVLPDFYTHRKGHSSIMDQNSSIKGPANFLSRSNLQAVDNTSTSQVSSRMINTPFNKVSPRQFSLNISSPTNAFNIKPKGETLSANVTPSLYNRQATFFSQRPDASPDAEMLSSNRANTDLEPIRLQSSLSQMSVRKSRDTNLPPTIQLPGSPFRASTNSRQKILTDTRSPIRVVDMGNNQLVVSSRNKPDNHEDGKDPRLHVLMKDREPKFKDEVVSVRDGIKSVRSVDSVDKMMERMEVEGDMGNKKLDSTKNANKFPKEIFCLNLRKRVGV